MKRSIHTRPCESLFALLCVILFSASVLHAQPTPPADPAKVADATAALASLKAHILGTSELTPEQIIACTKTLNDNKNQIGRSAELITACFDLVQTYDTRFSPLWVGYKNLSTKRREAGDEIHWAIFWVMQDLVDEAYNPACLERFSHALDGQRFACADLFPGKVEAPIEAEPYTVKINGSYPETWGAPILGAELPARKPTGAYLVPGTIATVTVPESLVNKGYQVRVGAHSWDLSNKPRVLRLHRVSTVYDITSIETKVANPLGGGIYIEVPLKADAGVVEVTVRNVARSPYFSWKSFDKTTLEQWRDVERNRKAPWADFQSDKFMMQVPTSWVYKLDDPDKLMEDWDKSMDIVNDLMGRPHQYGRETLYAQVDLQLRGSAFHPGYPGVNRGYDPTKDYGGYHDNHLVRGPQFAHSYEFHELGHGMLFPKYEGDRESAVNLLYVPVLCRGWGVELNESFRRSLTINNDFVTLESTAVEWMVCDHFLDGTGMLGYERQYQPKGHAKFVDIARLFGWDALGKFWHMANQDDMDSKPWPRDTKDTDEYTLRLSQAAGADLRPLIAFWGIATQDNEKSDADIKAAGLKPSDKVYNLLVKYQSLIPKDNAAFREFTLKWWGKEPSEKGFTTERNHAARWNDYDEAYAAKVRARVQAILDRYFPNGQPM
ncbi:MAG: hypothetical protein GC164_13455 [Phycisphaera sp.]|nr:hypothetical protein [Phycisphaera sp.]